MDNNINPKDNLPNNFQINSTRIISDNSSNAKDTSLFENKLKKKRKAIVKRKKIKNPGYNRFNLQSHFIYDMSKKAGLLLEIDNKN